MTDTNRSKSELIEELEALRARVALLEGIEAKRKRIERDLYDSEVRFRRLFENMLDGYLLSGWDGQILMENAAAAALLRYEKGELLTKNMATDLYVNPEDRENMKEALLETSKLSGYEIAFWRKDGEILIADCSLLLIMPETDEEKLVIEGIFRDITERKNAEEKLRASEERYRAIVEDQTEFVVRRAPDGTRTFVNVAYCRYFDQPRENLFGNAVIPLVTAENEQVVREKFARLTIESPVEVNVHRAIKPDGNIVWHEWVDRGIFDEDGTIIEMQSVGRDITDRKSVEDELTATQALLQAAIEQSPAGIIIADAPNVTIRMANQVALDFRGTSKETLTNIDVDLHAVRWQAYYPDGTPYTSTDLPLSRAVLQGETVRDEELVIHHENGYLTWLTANAAPIRDADGHIEAGIVVFTDVTERKRAERELQQYQGRLEELVEERTAELQREITERKRAEEILNERTQQLEAANAELQMLSQMKDQFVSNVSHELRTPISNIKLRQHLMINQPNKFDIHLTVLRRETERLSRIIDDLLYLSRIDQDRVAYNPMPVDLNILVHRYVNDRASLAENRGVALTSTLADDLARIQVDEGLVEQVLSILMTNALNYTPAGGKLSISTHMRHDQDKHWVGFSVSDTGPGISEDDQKQLFTRFFRGSVGRESGVSGTGLGLAIAKEIVDRHQGEIEVFSEGIAGRGTKFLVWLPTG